MAPPSTGLNNPKKILLVHLGGLGDLLLSVPAFRSLRDLFPEAFVTLLACEGSVELMRSLPHFDRIETIPSRSSEFRGLRFLWHWQPWRSLPTLISLRRERFDLAINFCEMVSTIGALKMALLFGIVGAKETAGRDTEGRGWFLDTRSFEPYRGEVHEVEYVIRLVEAVGGKELERHPPLELPLSKEAEEEAEGFLSQQGYKKGEFFICVNPGGAFNRRWGIGNFQQALLKILAKANGWVLCMGSLQEIALGQQLKQALRDRLILGNGRLSLRASAAILRRSRLLLSNDTGTVHVAAAVGTPVVVVAGSTDPVRFRPYLPQNQYILLQKPVACAPCEKNSCWRRSLDRVTPEEVAEACLTLLERFGMRR